VSGLLALGDSFTCGEGVGVHVPLASTWAGVLATALGLEHRSLAVAGSRVRDVVSGQLPVAGEAAVSTLVVGLNDVARGGFDATAVREGLRTAVHHLADRADTVVVGRLHDPSRLLWMPLPLRSLVRRRLEQLNAAVDEAAELPGVVVVDLAAVPELRHPAGWAVDRVHPSVTGHRGLARAAAAALGHDPPTAEDVGRAPGLVRRVAWSTRHGAPYLAGQLIGRWT
jgi:lysophospholipase L1-like esterase